MEPVKLARMVRRRVLPIEHPQRSVVMRRRRPLPGAEIPLRPILWVPVFDAVPRFLGVDVALLAIRVILLKPVQPPTEPLDADLEIHEERLAGWRQREIDTL